VVASVDCGATWSVIYDKEGAALKSTYPVTFPYVPASGQWRTDSVSLLGLTGMPEVIFMLKSISNFGNNLFVDNIFVGNIASGIHDLNSEQNLTVTPNPVSDIAVVRLGATVTPSAKGEILSVEGRQVMTFDVLNSKEISLDVAKLSPGYYLIRITDGSSYFVKPLVKD
jgi:hypothetical protein